MQLRIDLHGRERTLAITRPTSIRLWLDATYGDEVPIPHFTAGVVLAVTRAATQPYPAHVVGTINDADWSNRDACDQHPAMLDMADLLDMEAAAQGAHT